MGNRATITAAPFDRSNVAIYVHWNGGRASIEAFCKAAKELGYRDPASDPAYGLARLTGLIATYFGLDGETSLGIGTVDQLIEAGDDNGCWVIGGDWEIVEQRGCNGRVIKSDYAPLPADSPYAKMSDAIVAQVRAAANAVAQVRSAANAAAQVRAAAKAVAQVRSEQRKQED
jgi:hypothetical protein